MKKNKNVNAPAKVETLTTSPAKESKKDSALTKANVEKVAKAVTEPRPSKYAYPDNVKTASDKKAFRRNARAKSKVFAREMEKLQSSTEKSAKAELKKMSEEFKAFEASTYNLEVVKS